KRRTEILPEAAEMNELDLIKPEDVVVTLSAAGYIKRVPLDTYRRQRRGGRGMLASSSKEEDYLKYLVLSNTLDYLLFFTNLGRVHWLRAYQVPEQSRQAKGRPIINLLRLQENETVAALIPVNEFKTDQFLLMVTERGLVKKTSLASYSRPRNGGIIAMGLRPEDRLVGVRVTGGQYEIFLSTRRGMAIRFPETNTRAMGRTATGVIGVRLRDGDVVVGGEALGEAVPLLTVTEKGYGKRSLSSLYRLQKRGGKGIIDIHVLDRKDKVVAMRVVKDSDEILILTQKGQAIRIKGSEIRCIGRNTKGVKLINLLPGDRITDFVVSEIDRAEEEAREEGDA
ncbi:MAG TPA: DNA gyrase C-terminal beta-propeller domain-containing protein, partial [bacterium]|nr:DNA gyrase C-terminal beta-propeller domain-containing protein [bacterium]